MSWFAEPVGDRGFWARLGWLLAALAAVSLSGRLVLWVISGP